jgi:hypothetical protein
MASKVPLDRPKAVRVVQGRSVTKMSGVLCPRFAGKAWEPGTLASTLAGLGTPAGALIVMDAGIATDIIVSSPGWSSRG